MTPTLWRGDLDVGVVVITTYTIMTPNGAIDAFRQGGLAKTIPTADESRDVRPEVHDVLYPYAPKTGRLRSTM